MTNRICIRSWCWYFRCFSKRSCLKLQVAWHFGASDVAAEWPLAEASQMLEQLRFWICASGVCERAAGSCCASDAADSGCAGCCWAAGSCVASERCSSWLLVSEVSDETGSCATSEASLFLKQWLQKGWAGFTELHLWLSYKCCRYKKMLLLVLLPDSAIAWDWATDAVAVEATTASVGCEGFSEYFSSCAVAYAAKSNATSSNLLSCARRLPVCFKKHQTLWCISLIATVLFLLQLFLIRLLFANMSLLLAVTTFKK